MKNLSFSFLLAAMLSVVFVGCDDDTVDPIQPTFKSIVDVALEDPELSILVEAVVAADLADVLADENSIFTVFAPTNAAFADLLVDLGVSKEELLADPNLANILLFHVLVGEAKAASLSTGYVKPLNQQGPGGTSPDLRVVVSGGVTLNGSSAVTTADVDADNGVIHKISKVMLPPSIVDLALSNDAFTSLVAALTAPDNTTDFVSVLSGDGPFTVFAPANDAFQALLDSNDDWTELTDIPVAIRDAVLKYHVSAAGNVESGSLTEGQVIPTLEGSTFSIDLTSGAAIDTGSGQNVKIIATDVQGTNGIIHVVEAVLLPAI
jgi:uncharacterized surface protein with fasciclin (FAS1) repeats